MITENKGPMGPANQEIRDAIDQFAAQRRAQRPLPALLERTDAILNELESLNLIQVRRTPRALRSDLTTLVAETYRLITRHLSDLAPRRQRPSTSCSVSRKASSA